MAYKPMGVFSENEKNIRDCVLNAIKDKNILLRFKIKETRDNRRILTIKRAGYLDMCSVSFKDNSFRVKFLRHKKISPINIRSWFQETKCYVLPGENAKLTNDNLGAVVNDVVDHLTNKALVKRTNGAAIPVVSTKDMLNDSNVFGGLITGIELLPEENIEISFEQDKIKAKKSSMRSTSINLKVGNYLFVNTKNDFCIMNPLQVHNYFKVVS